MNSIITKSESFVQIFSDLSKVINTDSSILLTGETGVGKELFAEFIHRNSNRKDQPFIKVGLSAIPPDLLESELFGHVKGAYTNASQDKKGPFELADKGTIFLDDIDDFPFNLQSKLLRVLEAREVKRVGAEKAVPIDVRLVTATKLNLKEMVEQGLFRADLYYRINVVPFNLPPLRERLDDIVVLADYFIKRFEGNKHVTISPEAIEVLKSYHWPGNIRELKNVIRRTVLFADSKIRVEDLPEEITSFNQSAQIIKSCLNCFVSRQIDFRDTISCLEANLITRAIRQCNGNKHEAAKLLNLPASTFNDKLKKYKLENEDNFCPVKRVSNI